MLTLYPVSSSDDFADAYNNALKYCRTIPPLKTMRHHFLVEFFPSQYYFFSFPALFSLSVTIDLLLPDTISPLLSPINAACPPFLPSSSLILSILLHFSSNSCLSISSWWFCGNWPPSPVHLSLASPSLMPYCQLHHHQCLNQHC